MSDPKLVSVIGYVVIVSGDDGPRCYGDDVWELRADAEAVRAEAARMGMEDPEVFMLIPPGAVPMTEDRRAGQRVHHATDTPE